MNRSGGSRRPSRANNAAKRLPQTSTGTPAFHPSKPKGPPGSAGRSGLRLRPEAALELPHEAFELGHALAEGGVLGVQLGEGSGRLLVAPSPPADNASPGESRRAAACGRQGRPQTAQRPASGGVRTSPGARSGMGPYATPTQGQHGGWRASAGGARPRGRPCAGIVRGQQRPRAKSGGDRSALPRDLFGSCRVVWVHVARYAGCSIRWSVTSPRLAWPGGPYVADWPLDQGADRHKIHARGGRGSRPGSGTIMPGA
jgi:hypothetical protein